MSDVLPSQLGTHRLRWPPGRSLEEDIGYWCVAYLKPRNEKAMARDCERLEVGYYLPLYEKRVRRRDNNKLRKSILPLFPGYLPFVDRDRGRHRILETKRIVHILDVPDQEGLVQDLRQVWQAVTSGVPIGGVQTFTAGQAVRVNSGPLEGLTGVVQEIRGNVRLLLNVEAFQMAVNVEIDYADVEVLR
ncbi:MAG: transcription termination/antitermination NusG family protein [bacterium]